jgi:hypothetical protein
MKAQIRPKAKGRTKFLQSLDFTIAFSNKVRLLGTYAIGTSRSKINSAIKHRGL